MKPPPAHLPTRLTFFQGDAVSMTGLYLHFAGGEFWLVEAGGRTRSEEFTAKFGEPFL